MPVTLRVAGLTIVAALLRLLELGDKSLWLDETYTAHVVRLPLRELLKTPDASHLVLYYVLMRGWTQFAGQGEVMLRLPSALFAIVTVPLVCELGVQLADQNVGLLAGLFLTVNATCIEYAQDARAYALLMMTGTMAMIIFVRTARRGSAANAVGYIIASAGSIYAHLFAALLIPAEWIALPIFHSDRKTILRLAAYSVVIGIVVAPVMWIAFVTSPGQLVPMTNPLLILVPRLIAIFAGV